MGSETGGMDIVFLPSRGFVGAGVGVGAGRLCSGIVSVVVVDDNGGGVRFVVLLVRNGETGLAAVDPLLVSGEVGFGASTLAELVEP